MKLSASNKALLPGMIFCGLGAIFVMRFGALILILTIIPSIVAFFIDRAPKKPSFKVVAACNLSAALPYIVPIINFSLKKQYSEAGMVMDDGMVWAFIYCGAAAGWGMLFLSKFVARVITLMHYDYGIKVLEKKQELLVKEWGEEIIDSTTRRARNN
jgi:hypothetical protein